MSLAEHRLAVQLQSAGSLAEFRFQARVVPGWQGAIDFYCPETSLCNEVDDEGAASFSKLPIHGGSWHARHMSLFHAVEEALTW